MADNYLLATFIEETEEHLQTIEEKLLELEQEPSDDEIIEIIFRAIHSIKGGAGMVGVKKVNKISHYLENILEEIRGNDKKITESDSNLILEGVDILRHMVENEDFNGENIKVKIENLLKQVNMRLEDNNPELYVEKDTTESKDITKVRNDAGKDINLFEIKLNFDKDIFDSGTDPLMLIIELLDIGNIIDIKIDKNKLPGIYDLDAYKFYLSWELILKTDKDKTKLEEIFMFVEDNSDIHIKKINYPDNWMKKDEKGLKNKRKTDKSGKTNNDRETNLKKKETVRVDTAKLENILNDIAELMISQSQIKELISTGQGYSFTEELENSFKETDKLIRRIQEQVMSASMIAIGGTFTGLHRIVRDISKNSDKKIKLDISGKDTELDRKIIEELADPLKHLIRNAIDHGIEAPDERKKLHKDPEGTISLDAYHQEGNIIIEVSDDGRGIDKNKVLEKAQKRGLIESDVDLSEQDIYSLIFQAGFSTKDVVSDLSGRGVGLDVVKNNLDNIRGSIEIFSEKNKGTTFKIRVPLTLAIIDGIVLRIDKEKFVLPVTSVVELIDARAHHFDRVEGKGKIVNLRNEYIPVIPLYKLIKMNPGETENKEGILVIVQNNRKKIALQVDEIIGQEQVVIKNIKENMGEAEGFTGATILGNGNVSLILDVSSLFRLARSRLSQKV